MPMSSTIWLTFISRSVKLPITIRQAIIIVTEAKDMNPCVNTFRKPSPIRYPYLFNFITVVPVHSVAYKVAAVDGYDTL